MDSWATTLPLNMHEYMHECMYACVCICMYMYVCMCCWSWEPEKRSHENRMYCWRVFWPHGAELVRGAIGQLQVFQVLYERRLLREM